MPEDDDLDEPRPVHLRKRDPDKMSDSEARRLILEALDDEMVQVRYDRKPQDLFKLFRVPTDKPVEEEAADEAWLKAAAAPDPRLVKRARRHRSLAREYSKELGLDPDRPVTPIPPVPAGKQLVEKITIDEGRVFARIIADEETGLLEYQVIEPPLSPVEAEALEFIRDTTMRVMEPKTTEDKESLEAVLREWVEEIIVDYSVLVDDVAKERILYYLTRDYLGFGKLDPLMRDPMIEDVSCDGPDIPVFLFHREYQALRTTVRFEDDDELDAYITRVAQVCGKSISTAEPLLDATLPDGSRLQATLSREITTRGSSLTVRKVLGDPLTPADLVRLGTVSADLAALLWMGVEIGQSLIMAGATASGKTTSLNALGLFIPPQKKIVTIEDTREISLLHENWIAAVTRKAFVGEAVQEISMYRLLEAALRQRPEYLIVGEVRGPEAMTLFQAMATGHATYSTMHADSFQAAVNRLENPPINVPKVMLQNLDSLAIQLQFQREGRLIRRMKELVEVTGFDSEEQDVITNIAFKWNARLDKHQFTGRSRTLERFGMYRNLEHEEVLTEWQRRTRLLQWMADTNIRHVKDFWAVITAYYANPTMVMEKIDEVVSLKP